MRLVQLAKGLRVAHVEPLQLDALGNILGSALVLHQPIALEALARRLRQEQYRLFSGAQARTLHGCAEKHGDILQAPVVILYVLALFTLCRVEEDAAHAIGRNDGDMARSVR